MIHSLERLRKAIPGFNRRVFTFEDFRRIADREGIRVDFWQLVDGVNGFYGLNRKYKRPVKYIVIDQRLSLNERTRTAFHELIHHFLHVPQTNIKVYFSRDHASDRQDREANRFALMMKIPKPLILDLVRAPADDLHEYSPDELHQRMQIFEQFGE